MATFSRLKSGSWRVQIRRKGKYVNETFLRRKDAEEWALDIERRIDRREPATTRSRDVKLFGDLIALHRGDLEGVGKKIGRSKDASLTFLDGRLGQLRYNELDRERPIKFGKERAAEGAGPVTVGMDLGYIKTILTHAAAVHGITVSVEPLDLARVALAHLVSLERVTNAIDVQPKTSLIGSSLPLMRTNGSKSLLTVSFASLSQPQCGKLRLFVLNGAIWTRQIACCSFAIGRIHERRKVTINEFRC